MFVSSTCMEAHTHTYSHTLTIWDRGPDPQCLRQALDRLYKSALYTLHTHTLRVSALCVCVCVCVFMFVCVCVAKPVAVELRCLATALIAIIILSVAMVTSRWIWPNFKLIQALMYVFVTCKYEMDLIKNS